MRYGQTQTIRYLLGQRHLAIERSSIVETFRMQLGIGAIYRQAREIDGMSALRKLPESYEPVSDR